MQPMILSIGYSLDPSFIISRMRDAPPDLKSIVVRGPKSRGKTSPPGGRRSGQGSPRPLESGCGPDSAFGRLRQCGDEGGRCGLIGAFGGYSGGVGLMLAEGRGFFPDPPPAGDRQDSRDRGEADVPLAPAPAGGDLTAALLRHGFALDLVRHADT